MTWLREKSQARNVTAKEMAQGLGRLGFAAICLDWDRLEGGDRLQRPSRPPSACPSSQTLRPRMAGHGWVASWMPGSVVLKVQPQ